jgi:hypothetical protein
MAIVALVRRVHLGKTQRTLETYEPSCMGRPATFFVILKARGQKRVVGYVAAPEPSWSGRLGPEPRDT